MRAVGVVDPDDTAGPAPAGVGSHPLVERLRAVHLQMVEAVLGGEGLGTVAALAADAVGAPVAICVPRLGISASSPDAVPAVVDEVARYVGDRVEDRAGALPGAISDEVPIRVRRRACRLGRAARRPRGRLT